MGIDARKRLEALLDSFEHVVIRVGLDEEASSMPKKVRKKDLIVTDYSLTLGEVAVWNEYGTPTVPSRPAFTVTATSPEVHAKMSAAARETSFAQGEDIAVKVLEAAGNVALAELQTMLATWSEPPNAPFTIAKKGFDDPLEDTEQLHNELVARVEVRRQAIRRNRGKQLPTR